MSAVLMLLFFLLTVSTVRGVLVVGESYYENVDQEKIKMVN